MSVREIVRIAVAVLLGAAVMPPDTAAQDCLDYTTYLRWVHCGEPASNVGVTVVGTLAYVSSASEGLVVWDMSAPGAPVRLGAAVTPGSCLGNIVVGDLAYVADGYSPGFCVVDVSDPAAPFVRGSAGPGSGYCYDLAIVAPDTVWVADAYYGIRIFDVSDPDAPVSAGGFAPGGSPWAVEVHEGHAFLADDFGLKVYDLSLGADQGHQVGFVSFPDFNYGLARTGDIFFVTGYTGMNVVDATDPTAPVVVGYYDTPGPGVRVRMSGHLALVAESGTNMDDWAGLQVLDVTDPAVPVHVGVLRAGVPCYDVAPVGKFAFVTTEQRGVFAANIANPEPAPLAGVAAVGVAYQVAAAGDLACVAVYAEGLRVVDVADPAAPAILGTCDLTGYAVDVALQGNLAYVASGSPGLEIVDITDPAVPVAAGSVDPPGATEAVAVSGAWAYLAARDWGVQVVDVSDPDAPALRATLSLPDWPNGICVAGDRLYVACRRSGLQVANVADPAAPVLLGGLPLPNVVNDVSVVDGIAYVSGDADGLHIVDVTSFPPVLLATLHTPAHVQDVAVRDGVAYIADLLGGLQVANVADPAAPRLLGCAGTPTPRATGVAVADGAVCVADFTGGLAVARVQCAPVSSVPAGAPRGPALVARPNPSNPRTTLEFTLPRAAAVDLRVYDLAGRLVRTLLAGTWCPDARSTIDWDGRDDAGRTVASGVYLVRLSAGGLESARPVVVVR